MLITSPPLNPYKLPLWVYTVVYSKRVRSFDKEVGRIFLFIVVIECLLKSS